MWLIAVYVALTIVGSLVAYGIGLVVEQPHLLGFSVENPQTTISLATFLGLYFLNLWVAWQIAVRLTRPQASEA